MEIPRSDSNIDMNSDAIQALATEIFSKVNNHLLADSRQLWEASGDQFSDMGNESVRQHLISGVTFRLPLGSNEDDWKLEDIFDTVNVSHLDDIRRGENIECVVNYHDNLRTAMVENNNVVLSRTIMDWSREDGNVVSQQLIWSGSFIECQRLVKLFDQGNTSSIQFRMEEFSFHCQLRKQFLSRHEDNPVAASLSAIYSSPAVIIDQQLLDTSDEEKGILCVVCQNKIPIGFTAKQLPCKHLFHGKCILEWFVLKFNCPLCRHEFDKPNLS